METILSLLNALPKFTSQAELAEGIDTFITPKYHKDLSKYPRIPFEIGAEEIQKLQAAFWAGLR